MTLRDFSRFPYLIHKGDHGLTVSFPYYAGATEQWVNEAMLSRCDDEMLVLRVVLRYKTDHEIAFDRDFCVYTSDEALGRSRQGQDALLNEGASAQHAALAWYDWPEDTHVHLVTVSLQSFDAVSSFVLGVCKLLMRSGTPCSLYANFCNARLRGLIKPPELLFSSVRPHDVLFFNYSIYDPYLPALSALNCRKVLYYHGITPPSLIRAYSPELALACERGYDQMSFVPCFQKLMANSATSARVLTDALNQHGEGSQCTSPDEKHPAKEISVCPPVIGLRAFAEIALEPSDLSLPRVRLLYVGRIVPHKKIEDLLALFHEFHQREPDSCLLLAGRSALPHYDDYLVKLVAGRFSHLKSRVHRLGQVSQGALKSLYSLATAFVTMSEHEGFCVPLVEAMGFDVPVFAFAEPAITETLGQGGRVFSSKDLPAMAAEIHRVIHDDAERESIVAAQRKRVRQIEREADGSRVWEALEEVLSLDAGSL